MIETFITGANGFIGSHLKRKLDDPYAIPPACIPHENIVQGCSRNGERMFFLSTYGNMAHHSHHGLMIRANVTNLMYVAEQFRGWLCYMSSSSVLLPVQTPYSRTKRAAEEILQALPELKSCIVRPYSVTGVGEQKEHLIPTLIRSCMEGEEMPFDPYPVHDFVDVSDLVNGLIYLADNQMTGIYEFGSGIPHHNDDVMELVAHFCQKRPNLKMTEPLRSYDTDQWFCVNTPEWWHPKKTLSNSIEEMVEAYKSTH